jgi:hypothetical protein
MVAGSNPAGIAKFQGWHSHRSEQIVRWSRILIVCLTLCWLPEARGEAEFDLDSLLSEPLWRDRDAYDSSNKLMVLLHQSYASNLNRRRQAFRRFFSRFLDETDELTEARLSWLQFLHFASRYTVLESAESGCQPDTVRLRNWIDEETSEIVAAPAWQWEAEHFPSMIDRVLWKLWTREVAKTYFRAIIDEELFAFAIASDHIVWSRFCRAPVNALLRRVAALALQTFLQEGDFRPNGEWRFQSGVWTDHPDYAFAGNSRLAKDLPAAPVPDIGTDSSHFSRMPLILLNLACAHRHDPTTAGRLDEMRAGLAKLLLGRVLLMPTADFPAIRMTNYMSGDNGVYRYNYKTKGTGGGYGPYGLSSSFNIGWWAFLGQKLSGPYRAQLNSMPFPPTVIEVYRGAQQTANAKPRDRHPVFNLPGAYSSGLVRATLQAGLDIAAAGPECPH